MVYGKIGELRLTRGMVFSVAVAIGILVFAISMMYTFGIDYYILRTAGESALHGANPYANDALLFFTPVWSLLLLVPFSLLDFEPGFALWAVLGVTAWFFVLRKIKIQWLNIGLFMLNPFFIAGVAQGNYDWLVLLGILLPIREGVWLLMLKPQISFGLLLYWMKEHGIVTAIRNYWMPAVVLGVSLLVGLYRSPDLAEMPWNTSLGLWGVPIGLFLMWVSFETRQPVIALAAAPFLSPYVAIQTWAVSFLLLAHDRTTLIIGLVVSWVGLALLVFLG